MQLRELINLLFGKTVPCEIIYSPVYVTAKRNSLGYVSWLANRQGKRKKLNAHAWLISENITIMPKGFAFKEIYSV